MQQAIKSNDIVIVQQICMDNTSTTSMIDFECMCKAGNLEMASWYADMYLRPSNQTIRRCLKYASQSGHIHVVEWLMTMVKDAVCIHKALNAACKYGHLNIVRYLHDNFMCDGDFIGDLTKRNDYAKYTKGYLLQIACMYGHLDIVEYLMNMYPGAFIHKSFNTACRYGSLNIVKCLVSNNRFKEDDIHQGLKDAAFNKKLHIVEYIFDTFPDAHEYSDNIFDIACSSSLHIAQWLLQRYPDIIERNHEQAFIKACTRNCVDVLQWLHEKINVNDDTLLDCFSNACFEGRLQVAQHIVDNSHIEADNDSDFLDAVCESDHVHVLKWLIECGSSIDIQSALIHACAGRTTRVARFLLETYPEIDVHYNNEYIFLKACIRNNLPVIRLFTEYSDSVSSYHIMNYGTDMQLSCGYLITDKQIDISRTHIKRNMHDDFYVYFMDKINEACVLDDVKRVTAISKKKSAMTGQ